MATIQGRPGATGSLESDTLLWSPRGGFGLGLLSRSAGGTGLWQPWRTNEAPAGGDELAGPSGLLEVGPAGRVWRPGQLGGSELQGIPAQYQVALLLGSDTHDLGGRPQEGA